MYTAIDLFSGAGGLSLGLERAGFSLQMALEKKPDAVATHQKNFPDALHLCQDVRTLDFSQYKGITLLAGGPPCQPFSVSGKQKGSLDQRDMVPEFIRAVGESQPKAFLMENVEGLPAQFGEYLSQTKLSLQDLGYTVHQSILNAADFGVPQNRKRLFLVGFASPLAHFEFPKPTHGPLGLLSYVSVREALKGVPPDIANTARIVFAKRPILRKSPYAGMLLNGAGRPLDLSGLSHTITASAGGNRTHILDEQGELLAYHRHLQQGGLPYQGEAKLCRRLTVRESARLQSFPDTFEFVGTQSQRYAQVGNAVPPLLAYAVGKAILRTLTALEVAEAGQP